MTYLTLLAVKICIFAFLQKYKNANVWMSILDPHPPRVTPSEIAYLTLLAVKICIVAFLQKYKNAKFVYPTPPFSEFARISSM